jgi:hypothetical protein
MNFFFWWWWKLMQQIGLIIKNCKTYCSQKIFRKKKILPNLYLGPDPDPVGDKILLEIRSTGWPQVLFAVIFQNFKNMINILFNFNKIIIIVSFAVVKS